MKACFFLLFLLKQILKGLTESLITWYWPDYVQKKKEENLNEELNVESKQLGSDQSEDESETFEVSYEIVCLIRMIRTIN